MAVAGEAIQSGVGRQKTRTIDQSYWSLVWWRFRRNRLAIVGAVIVIGFYVVCGVAAEFFSPYPLDYESRYLEIPPQWPRMIDAEGNFHLRPFVYGVKQEMDMKLRKRFFVQDTEQQFPLYFLTLLQKVSGEVCNGNGGGGRCSRQQRLSMRSGYAGCE